MWAEVNGERKKVACGPCIRGHRSSKCDHRDRVLVEVRKPGRPLSSCPHPSGSCSCERIVINYTIPKSSECACPSERAQPTATVAGNSRIQKNRRKSTAVNTSSLEKAIRASQDAETDTSSITRTPTERSGSIDASPLSSASSTPRLLPAQNGVSSCCKPKPVQAPVKQASCCSSKAEQVPEPVQVKSCCSGPKPQTSTIANPQPNVYQHFGQQFQFQLPSQFQAPHYQNFHPQVSLPPASLPFGLGAPIYNHAAAAYQQPTSIPMSPVMSGPISSHVPSSQLGQHVPEHNCHCGDSCSCFGCAAHPNNATMMEYVRLMAQFQYTGGFGTVPPPLYDMPTYPHHPGFGAEAFNPLPQGMSTPTPTQMSFQAGIELPVHSNTSVAVSGPWQQPPVPAPAVPEPQYLEPSSYATSTPVDRQLLLKTEEIAATPVADSPSDGKDEETPTLSPSSYFWNQMVLPGCDDASGTCQCGDGCECVGCLTHGGHTGVPLEGPAISEHDTFPDFAADAGLSLEDSTNFMTYNVAPT
ncbi:hypothetical protein BKA66DRAFT_66751 [Pyrenochaeta sp. MPI-SDFR-AT-0127]|nr:hypothetical protein BKA66DRAFT_66751 [Pyrenochaeta sp. MPI-SDFR-AT-0127]